MPNPPHTTFNITTNADQGTVYNGTFNGNNFHSGAAAVPPGPINEPLHLNEQTTGTPPSRADPDGTPFTEGQRTMTTTNQCKACGMGRNLILMNNTTTRTVAELGQHLRSPGHTAILQNISRCNPVPNAARHMESKALPHPVPAIPLPSQPQRTRGFSMPVARPLDRAQQRSPPMPSPSPASFTQPRPTDYPTHQGSEPGAMQYPYVFTPLRMPSPQDVASDFSSGPPTPNGYTAFSPRLIGKPAMWGPDHPDFPQDIHIRSPRH
ncbi:hypothetical protein FA13DRAFT_1794211 [Coprinellus micaceus]|uniref:Uncharacterized protein n=1 Tax=Coprinellus micaceus TaxID=71717 RepID=A0A4Y7T239_COPMI|nr:hypothetical protein FA13DRAFT_1794211 [Coprinellus micaceus]